MLDKRTQLMEQYQDVCHGLDVAREKAEKAKGTKNEAKAQEAVVQVPHQHCVLLIIIGWHNKGPVRKGLRGIQWPCKRRAQPCRTGAP